MKAFENAQGCQRDTLPGKQHQLDLFATAKEQRRSERLRRILSIDPRIQTADHAFTERAFQEATKRAQEASRGS